MRQGPRVVVVGAGAFGGWTALHLLRQGAAVTLLDAWGPGNSRASSGGDTRVLRATYADRIYAEMVARALPIWKESERRWNRPLYRPTGVLWMVGAEDAYERQAVAILRELGLRFEELETAEAKRRFPAIEFEGVRWAIREEDAGYLLARQACAAVLEGFLAEGGEYHQAAVRPFRGESGRLDRLALVDGTHVSGDRFVFACGAWLGKLFPDVLADRIRPTRQEVFYFGTPSEDAGYSFQALPVWIESGERFYYGIPGSEWRGFKIGDDTRGEPFDPTHGERTHSPAALAEVRKHMEFRFPGLKGAPLLEARVCQYENSPDLHFIIDRHPRFANVWLVGGGSGHGFKHGPAVGAHACELVLEKRSPEPFFSLSRFGERA
jgi:monomeric sarcosine oxidase